MFQGKLSLETELITVVAWLLISDLVCSPYHRSVQSLSCVQLFVIPWTAAPGLPVHYQLPELTQTHVLQVGDGIQPSHPLSSPSALTTLASFLCLEMMSMQCVQEMVLLHLWTSQVPSPANLSHPITLGHPFGAGFDWKRLLRGMWSEPAQPKWVFILFPLFPLLSWFLKVRVSRRV